MNLFSMRSCPIQKSIQDFSPIDIRVILLGILLLVFPFPIVFEGLIPSFEKFKVTVLTYGLWRSIIMYEGFLVAIICGQLLRHLVMFIFSGVLIVSYLQKRRIFPNLAFAFLFYNLLLEIIYFVVGRQVYFDEPAVGYIAVIGLCFIAVSPYLMFSNRLREFFDR